MKFLSALKKLLLLTVLLSSNSIAAQYNIDDNQNIQYFGYAGYQYLYTRNNIKSTFDNAGSPELGLNIIYNNRDFQIFNQFRYGTDSGIYLVYNFMQYTFNLKEDIDFIIKGGKIRNDFGLYNTSRINPTTRQGVIMPQSIYWDAFDEFLTSSSGVGATLKYKDYELTYNIGDPTIVNNQKTTRVFFGNTMNSVSTSFGSIQNASLTYSPVNSPLIVKGSWIHAAFGNDTGPAMKYVDPELIHTNIKLDAFHVGGEYRYKQFTTSAEMVLFRSPNVDVTDFRQMNKGYSFSEVYEVNDNINLRLNYNQYVSQQSTRYHPMDPWVGSFKDLNFGINYHEKKWMIQTEVHHINGAMTIDSQDYQSNPGAYKDWWMIGMNINYSF